MKKLGPRLTSLLCTAWITAGWTTAMAGAANDVMADAPAHIVRTAVSDDELSDMRGGYLVADGIKLDFAATIKTFVDGQLGLQTNLVWTPTGAVTTQTLGDNVATVSADVANAMISAAGLRGTQVAGSGGATQNGATTLVQQVTANSLANMVFTTASNQNILQTIDVNLTLPGFAANQADMARGLLGMRLATDGATGSIGALH